MTGAPYVTVLERAQVTGVAIKSSKHGKYLRVVLDVDLDGSVDVNGLAHELYEQPARVRIESLQLGFAQEPAEATG